MNKENGVNDLSNSKHAPPVEETGFLDFISPDSPSPVLSLVQLKGFLGIFPGLVVSDSEALTIPKNRIAGHIRPGDVVDYKYDEEGLLVAVARYYENGPDSIDGLSLWAKDPVTVCWKEIEYDEEAVPGDSGPLDWR